MKIEKHDRREKMNQIINHAVLSLDFWQDTVLQAVRQDREA